MGDRTEITIGKENEEIWGDCENLPILEKNCVPIVFASSDYYLPYCAVSIKSLLENISQNYHYDIFVLVSDIDRYNVQMLLQITLGYNNVSLHLLNVSTYVEKYKLFTYPHITRETYYRLLVPTLFKDYSNVIFLDSDVIVRDDVSKLSQLDLSDYYLAASHDVIMSGLVNLNGDKFGTYIRDSLGMEDAEDYFNAGIIVYNCKRIFEEFGDTFFLQEASSKQYMIVDQDVLNKTCIGKILFTNVEWNFNPDSNTGDLLNPIRKATYIEAASESLKKEYYLASQNPKIIHYTDTGKPWLYPDDEWADAFWEIAKSTPYYETLLFRLFDFQAKTKTDSIIECPPNVVYQRQGKLIRRSIIKVFQCIFKSRKRGQ